MLHAATPVEAGTDYQVLQTPMPVAVPGKIEVIEFFGYWCPHCNAFEPRLESWVKTLPKDVVFKRIPVAWQDGQIPYQRLFYALEAMGASHDVHAKVFKAIHEQHLRLDGDANLAAFATAIGVDKTKLVNAMKGFSVDAWMRTANQQAKSYQIEGVPTLAVNGMYVTSPEMAKGEVQALNVVDALIQKARARR
jgi:thiol:disulfide interchange protein DsbA